jgi:hypothetical protein
MAGSEQSDSNVTLEADSQSQKYPLPSASTEDGMQIEARQKQFQCGFSVTALSSHRKSALFNALTFLHRSKAFPPRVSLLAKTFLLWPSNPGLSFRLVERVHLGLVHHFKRFACLHQLKRLQNHVS